MKRHQRSAEQQAEAKQAAQERVQELKKAGQSLIAELALGHTEQFDRYVDFSRRFHNYSFGNQAAIYWQRPTARYVAGYQAWIDKFDRHVVKGAKAIWILAPCIAKRETETEEGETEVERVRFFRAASVFDVAIPCACGATWPTAQTTPCQIGTRMWPTMRVRSRSY